MPDMTNPESGVSGMSLDEAAHIADGRDDEQEGEQDEDEAQAGDRDDYDEEGEEVQPEEDGDAEIDYDGAKYRVPAKLKEAFLRQQDYTQKTQKLAEQRQYVEQHAQAVAQERNYYANQLSGIVQQLGGAIQQLPTDEQLAELAHADPLAYIQQKAERDKTIVQYQQAAHAQAQIMAQQQAYEQQQLADYLTSERNSLAAKLPEWKDAKIAAKEQAELTQYLGNEGYAADELSELYDHRALLVARKAMLYDKLMSQRSQQRDPRQLPPKPVRVLQPGAQAQPQRHAPKELVERFKRSGSIDDALAIMNRRT